MGNMLANLISLVRLSEIRKAKLQGITITLAFLLFIGVSVVPHLDLAGKESNYHGLIAYKTKSLKF